jgi:hypothetical protein
MTPSLRSSHLRLLDSRQERRCHRPRLWGFCPRTNHRPKFAPHPPPVPWRIPNSFLCRSPTVQVMNFGVLLPENPPRSSVTKPHNLSTKGSANRPLLSLSIGPRPRRSSINLSKSGTPPDAQAPTEAPRGSPQCPVDAAHINQTSDPLIFGWNLQPPAAFARVICRRWRIPARPSGLAGRPGIEV